MDDDIGIIEEHNQKSLEELVENFSEVFVYLVDGRSIAISKDNDFKFTEGKFIVEDKNIEVNITDIGIIEFSD